MAIFRSVESIYVSSGADSHISKSTFTERNIYIYILRFGKVSISSIWSHTSDGYQHLLTDFKIVAIWVVVVSFFRNQLIQLSTKMSENQMFCTLCLWVGQLLNILCSRAGKSDMVVALFIFMQCRSTVKAVTLFQTSFFVSLVPYSYRAWLEELAVAISLDVRIAAKFLWTSSVIVSLSTCPAISSFVHSRHWKIPEVVIQLNGSFAHWWSATALWDKTQLWADYIDEMPISVKLWYEFSCKRLIVLP